MTYRPRILLVEDDTLVRDSLSTVLEAADWQVVPAGSAEDGEHVLESSPIDVVVSDVRLPGQSGLALLHTAKSRDPALPVVMITAFGSIDDAVAAMREGATDYLAKPIDDYVLVQKIRRALSERRLRRENERLRETLGGEAVRQDLIAEHRSMQQVLATIDAVASTRATVLIHGESGTGKTLLAREIHRLSDRSGGPFVEVSCGSLPDPLLESELFGYEPGAFTGADKPKPGKFEVADSGTLFLDEIANATPALQVKLLRVLQDRIFERLGSNAERKTDVRLLLATNADLEKQVDEGRFREDLYYRINVITIALPPLRERASDVPRLAEHFLRAFRDEHGKAVVAFQPEVMSFLCGYEWPGNVRELENVVEHAVVMARDGLIGLEDLPPRYLARSAGPDGAPVRPLKEAMEVPEREYILRVLRLNRGNRQKTAEMLQVNRTTLFNKMKKYRLFSEPMEV